MASASPRAILIAGPNGAGKTTFAREFLPAEGNCSTFTNADLIAQGLSPFFDASRWPPVRREAGGLFFIPDAVAHLLRLR